MLLKFYFDRNILIYSKLEIYFSLNQILTIFFKLLLKFYKLSIYNFKINEFKIIKLM